MGVISWLAFVIFSAEFFLEFIIRMRQDQIFRRITPNGVILDTIPLDSEFYSRLKTSESFFDDKSKYKLIFLPMDISVSLTFLFFFQKFQTPSK